MTLLLVEDDVKTVQALSKGLNHEGFDLQIATSGEEAFDRLKANRCDLIVLDWMLPGLDGLEFVTQARQRGSRTPVLFLTARDAVEDRVTGLEAGADDYLVKPFAFAELLARIRALLRRGQAEATELVQEYAGLKLDFRSRRAWRDAHEMTLTPREFDLLAYLVAHADQTVTRTMLARDVWREANRLTPLDNVIEVHLAHLRKKVDRPGQPKLIHTIRGVGYVLSQEKTA